MQLHPLADRVIARPIEAATKTASGILLPEATKDKTQMAEVLAVGKDVKEIKAGDKVIHTEYGPNRVTAAGEEVLIIKEEDVLAVAKDK